MSAEDLLADEAAELDGYFSDTPLEVDVALPELRTTMETAIILNNLPKIGQAKLEKLTNVVRKLLGKIGTLKSDEATGFSGLLMPFDDANDATYGFCFAEFETEEEAKKAALALDDYAFDKKHKLKSTLYTRAQELAELDVNEFVEAEPKPYKEKPRAIAWLEDSNQRDQYVIRHGQETVANWFDGKSDPIVDYDGSREKEAGVQWCESYCFWSPHGSYLATLVQARGVILWSGGDYAKAGRFLAPGVKYILFSPNENYLLTSNNDPNDPAALQVFHVPTEKLLRAFSLYPDGVSRDAPPPQFLWSHDDQYLARMGKDLISLYETPSMKLLDQRSMAAEGICEFQWSPSSNVLAYWAPEAPNSPAHVDIIEIPSRKKLRQKNLFNVTKCSMVWHKQGDFLAVKVTRHSKTKKTFYNNIELFRMNEEGVPVEMLEIKDAVKALEFEPNGTRFAMIHAEHPSATKVDVTFYDMMKREVVVVASKKGGQNNQFAYVPELNKIETLEGKGCNSIYWSPAGSTIIMASLGDNASGTLEFYDTDNKTLVVKEHYRATDVFWDPDGRSVATCVTQPIEGGHFKFAMDNGYILWSFQGRQLYQQSYESFYQFQWRPRAQVLTKQEARKVKKKLKKYEEQFDKADRERERARFLEETKEKRAERAKFRAVLARNKATRASQRAEHIALLGGYDSDDESNYIVRDSTVETILSTKDEMVI